ncbi:hypothetical protein GDO78_023281, partial [Eleutherodactylus coqui]
PLWPPTDIKSNILKAQVEAGQKVTTFLPFLVTDRCTESIYFCNVSDSPLLSVVVVCNSAGLAELYSGDVVALPEPGALCLYR